jgi:hypothetical protein
VLNIAELRWLVGTLLGRRDQRVRVSDATYRQFVDTIAQAAADALGYATSPVDWVEEWLVAFYRTADTPPDGGILSDPRFDGDVQAEWLAGVAAAVVRPPALA